MNQDGIIHRTISFLETLPTLPCSAAGTVQLAFKEDLFADDLVKVIEVDPVLTLAILKEANAPGHDRSGKITNLPEAVRIVGLQGIRKVVINNPVMDVFLDRRANYGIDPVNFWMHSMGTAIYARELSRSFEELDPQEAFLAGLLHDIGKVFLCTSCQEAYPEIIAQAYQDSIPLHNAESEQLNCNHAEVAGWLLQQWKIPPVFTDVILHHHHPVESAFTLRRHFLLAGLVALANNLCYGQKIGSGDDPAKATLPPNLYKSMGIPREALKETIKQVPVHFSDMKGRIEWEPLSQNTFFSVLNQTACARESTPPDLPSTSPAPARGGKELQGINSVGISLLGCNTVEAAVGAVAGGLVKSFTFSCVVCSSYHDDQWEYRSDALLEEGEQVCRTELMERSVQEDILPESQDEDSWLHIDLNGKKGVLGYIRIKPGRQCDVPMETMGLLLALCAKLVAETLERIRSQQRIEHLSEDLSSTAQRLEKEKEKAENQKSHKEDLLNSIPMGVLLLDRMGTIGFVNPEARSFLPSDRPLKGRRIQDLFKNEELDRGICKTLEGDRIPPHELSASGAIPLEGKAIRWSLVPLRNATEWVDQLLLIFEDLTGGREPREPILRSPQLLPVRELPFGTG